MSFRLIRRFAAQIVILEAEETGRAITAASFPHMTDDVRDRTRRDLRRRMGGGSFDGMRRIPKDQIGQFLGVKLRQAKA